MHVSQFCITPIRSERIEDAARDTWPALNTHDTPTFAGFWQGKDIEDRIALGLLSPAEAQIAAAGRAPPDAWRSSLT